MRSTLAAVMVFIMLLTLANTLRAEGPDGVALYEANCANCHGGIENTMIPGRSYSRIKSAVRNIGRMGGLREMKDDDLKAIADVLLVAGDPDEIDGVRLYAVLCSGCHRGLERSTIRGAGVEAITAAAKERKCGTDHANLLDGPLTQKISDALNAAGK